MRKHFIWLNDESTIRMSCAGCWQHHSHNHPQHCWHRRVRWPWMLSGCEICHWWAPWGKEKKSWMLVIYLPLPPPCYGEILPNNHSSHRRCMLLAPVITRSLLSLLVATGYASYNLCHHWIHARPTRPHWSIFRNRCPFATAHWLLAHMFFSPFPNSIEGILLFSPRQKKITHPTCRKFWVVEVVIFWDIEVKQ